MKPGDGPPSWSDWKTDHWSRRRNGFPMPLLSWKSIAIPVRLSIIIVTQFFIAQLLLLFLFLKGSSFSNRYRSASNQIKNKNILFSLWGVRCWNHIQQKWRECRSELCGRSQAIVSRLKVLPTLSILSIRMIAKYGKKCKTVTKRF